MHTEGREKGEDRKAATHSARAGLAGKLSPRRIFCAQHGAPETTRSCRSNAASVPQASSWCMPGQKRKGLGERGTGAATGNRSRQANGRIFGHIVDMRATSSSPGLFASPCAISGKMLYERDPAPPKLLLRCGPLHPCVRCCPDILCRDFSSTLCGSLPARPPGACIPLQLGLSAYMLWLQCMLTVPGCMCCLLCMPASPYARSDIWVCACGHASRVVICLQALSALCRPPALPSASSTIIGFSHTITPSSIFSGPRVSAKPPAC